MRWTRWGSIAALCTAGLLFPGGASALVLAPPGHAGANQYFEVIPTSAGNAAPPGSVSGSGSAAAGPSALTDLGQGRTGDVRLARLGKDGQAAAALAASTAPAPVRGTGHGQGVTGVAGGTSQGSPSSGVANAITGSDAGGLGILLPLLLGTALVVAIGIALARVRRRSELGA